MTQLAWPNVIPTFERIRNDAHVEVASLSTRYRATCSITRRPFGGVLIVTWKPKEWMPEYFALDEFIHELCQQEEITHEQVASRVAQSISERLNCQVIVNATVDSRDHPRVSVEVAWPLRDSR